MLWRACGAGLIAAVLCYLLGELGFRGKRVISSFAVVLFLLVFADLAEDIIGSISSVQLGDEEQSAISAALKIIGVGQGFGICASVCSELSEGGIASAIALVGKAEILLIMLPFLEELFDIINVIMK